MRIIMNDEMLFDDNYVSLTKSESDTLFKVVAIFAHEDKIELPLSFITAKIPLSDEFMEKVSFCLYFGKIVKIKKYFKWFKGNKLAVAKARRKTVAPQPVIEIVEEVVQPEVKKEEPKNKVDFDRIKDSYNEAFKSLKTPKIIAISEKRGKSLVKLFMDMKKLYKADLKEFDIYDFYEAYFDLIANDNKFNFTKGWMNTQSNSWFQPDLEFFVKEKQFTKIYEDYKNNK